jgi:peptidoglycan/xylan/chitin deacetylase (PgdA/CDA1 family)
MTRAITLLFHDVVAKRCWESSGMRGADADIYKLDVQEFRRHLQAIAQQLSGPPVTGSQLLSGNSTRHAVLLTFDDGGVSSLNPIANLLDELGWKAHFLITAGRIGTAGFLNSLQIRELHRRGHVIGSHSFSHPDRISACSDDQLDAEWRRSVRTLTEIISEPVRVASVPGGYYSARVASAAARHGIQLLFNSEPEVLSRTVDGCIVLGRFTVKRGYPPRKSAAIVAGARGPRIQQYALWNSKKVVKVLVGKHWLRARRKLLARSAQISSPPEPGPEI